MWEVRFLQPTRNPKKSLFFGLRQESYIPSFSGYKWATLPPSLRYGRGYYLWPNFYDNRILNVSKSNQDSVAGTINFIKVVSNFYLILHSYLGVFARGDGKNFSSAELGETPTCFVSTEQSLLFFFTRSYFCPKLLAKGSWAIVPKRGGTYFIISDSKFHVVLQTAPSCQITDRPCCQRAKQYNEYKITTKAGEETAQW